MPVRFSKALLLVEGLVLVLPIGVLFLTLVPGALFFFRSFSAFAASVLILIIGVALLAAIGVMGQFWSHGVEGLRALPKSWWRLCFAGAAISVLGGLYVILKKSVLFPGNDFFFALKLSAYGLPLLLPFVHVLLELFLRKRTFHAA
ncbi:MAG: hypothetical protein ABI616_11625 [Pseudomonadota bacterium]